MKETVGVVNEPLSLKIIFKGSGHPRFINLPEIPFPPIVETYPPVQKSQFSDKGIGIKEFEVLIIPKQEGQLVIPSFFLSTFNPKVGQYVSHKSPELQLSITKGKSNNNFGESFLNRTENKTQTSVLNNSPVEFFYWPSFMNYRNFIQFFVVLFCFFVFSLFVVFLKKALLVRDKSLKEAVNDKFVGIQALLDKKDWQKACVNMIQLGTYVLSSAQIQDSSSDWRQALKNLTPSLNEKYSSRFESFFKQLERLSFSPHSPSSDLALSQTKHLFKQGQILINQFLSHLK